ncbi:uncharacterized protein LOC134740476 [Cydia strobilella]|uniref:uncharacterized protein LOC134740476 n=1 Tax=Cydia strobilella TaxID=1100964 RepID=UPI0030064134
MGLTEKEKSRRYRERLKADPEKLAERKRKKRESYHKNKISISAMQPEDKKYCRTIWKLRKQEQRKRSKALRNILQETPPSSPSTLQEINIPQDQYVPTPPASPFAPLESEQNKKRGRKIIRRDRSKMYKENLKLRSQANMWKKKFEKFKKRAHRKANELNKIKEKRTVAENELYEKYKTLTRAIKKNYMTTKAREGKRMLRKIFENVDESRKKQIIQDSLGVKGSAKANTTCKGETELIKKVKCFFQRDNGSRNTAGKKETVTKGKEKVQKRFLLESMKNLFKAFKLENPGTKCSYFYFTKHRPFYVLRPTVDGRDMCLCKTHANAAAKIKALKQKRVINAVDTSTLILETVCDSNKMDCMFGTCVQCQDREIKINEDNVKGKMQWFEWVREEEIYVKGGKRMKSIKNVKILNEDLVQNMIDKFKEDLKILKKHIFNMKTQYRNFRQSVDNIKPNEAVILVDFSENYSAKCHEEIQAHHFGGSRNQITLHTVVVYLHDKDKNYKVSSFCSVSPCNIHQPAAIWAHLHPILTSIIEDYPEIDTIHYFSDGPFSQYRQKGNFFLACTKTFDYGFQAFSWSFFEAGHGKGAADGIGGFLKREADNKVATGKDITDAFGFYQALKESSKIKLFYIIKEKIDDVQNCIPKDLVPLPGTKDVHQIFSRIRGQLKYRNLSCFCSRGLCDCLHPKFYSPTPTLRIIPSPVDMCEHNILDDVDNIRDDIISSDDTDDDLPLSALVSLKQDDILFTDLHKAPNKSIYNCVYGSSDESNDEKNTTQPSVSGQNQLLPGMGDYLLVKVYGTKGKSYHIYACIAQSNIDDDGEIKVTFMKCVKGGKLFVLNEKDVSYVAYEDIVQKLPNPEIQLKRGVNYFKFPIDTNVFEK